MANIIEVPTFSDERGALSVVEKMLPFEIKRIYLIHGASGRRGGHRHKKNRQAMICVHGNCVVSNNDGEKQEVFTLNNPSKMLMLNTKDWHEMHSFSEDAVLLVLASEFYDINDYIDEPYQ